MRDFVPKYRIFQFFNQKNWVSLYFFFFALRLWLHVRDAYNRQIVDSTTTIFRESLRANDRLIFCIFKKKMHTRHRAMNKLIWTQSKLFIANPVHDNNRLPCAANKVVCFHKWIDDTLLHIYIYISIMINMHLRVNEFLQLIIRSERMLINDWSRFNFLSLSLSFCLMRVSRSFSSMRWPCAMPICPVN